MSAFNRPDDRHRKTRLIAVHLRVMGARRNVPGCWDERFLIIHERPDSEGRKPALRARRRIAKPARVPVGVVAGGGFDEATWWEPDNEGPLSSENEEWRRPEPAREGDDRSERFVQFLFSHDWFAVDLPNTTILPPETERLLSRRPGFFRNEDVPDYRLSSPRQIKQYRPICKFYDYGHELVAAEDAAYVLWDVWNLPIEPVLYVTAGSFDNRWPPLEVDTPIV